ncbi:cystathionine beta-lyase [Herbaspirillum sp. Sphag1AN]|uniref:cystathionine beta-lyase n=1 Tax=unclassified Herbaspirillum TaxID=2624150 RepID=UPI0016189378|nr:MULTISPECIES: cystathionine beta-lyase [unclassified Herbaspirillum]MBB3210947.1 cystathionine beta-lyase [Herbaspirillum sp. Sphag1AN]MBB3244577.1 cystathionine beta-lyase [Herbaspirillum sp. Sphag64]
MTKKNSPQTALVHSDYRAPDGFDAFPVGIHHASTVLFPTVAAMRARNWKEKSGYTYGLHGTPTTFTLEARLAQIEGGRHCRVVPSGLAAITMVNLAMLKTGDDVLLPDNVYGPNREQAMWLERDFGITARFYDPLIGAGIAELIQDNTRLIWTEAPGSVSMEVSDVPAICAAAKVRGVVVALDNTWSAGLAFAAFDHGIDIVMQALTKYHSGGSDVLMGAVITRDDELNHRIELAHMRLGFGVGMDDVYMVLRSLPSMRLRFDAHDAAAREIASWLKQRPEIAKVLHPALPDCPGHEIWQRDFTGAGGLFSVIFDPRFSEAQIDRFVDALTLFKIGFSWGGAHSLCVPYRMQSMRQSWGHQGELVRFNIGLESAVDLIADIEQGLLAMNAAT